MRAGFLAGAFLVACLSPAIAQMQSREGIALQNQILQLQQEVEQLRDQQSAEPVQPRYRSLPPPSRGGGAPNDMVATLLDRVSQLEDQVRQLTGRLDELANQTQRQGADLGKQIADLNFRLQTYGAGAAPVAPPTNPGGYDTGAGGPMSPPPTNLGAVPMPTPMPSGPVPPVSMPGAPPQPPRTPETGLQQGYAALGRRDYAAAEAAARDVLAGGRGPRSYDAQFLLAQALAGERNYQQAALAFDDAYDRARTGSHAPDALLGLANSLIALNQRPAACASLDKLRAEFPSMRRDLREAEGMARQRAGCR